MSTAEKNFPILSCSASLGKMRTAPEISPELMESKVEPVESLSQYPFEFILIRF